MSLDQFNQVVEAISDGRYSWACVLILRFAGYNPVHFIPYRTYSRLLKENAKPLNAVRGQVQPLTKIKDLSYQDALSRQEAKTSGGSLFMNHHFLSRWFLNSSKN